MSIPALATRRMSTTSQYVQLSTQAERRSARHEPLAERWAHEDPVDALLLELRQQGRRDEADAISAVLSQSARDEDEEAMRALVSVSWEADWDNAEDGVYDAY
jgi:hypothetical protein